MLVALNDGVFVPEPATLCMLLAGMLTMCSRRRRRCHNLVRFVGRAIIPVCRESRRFSVGANPTRPIGRSAGSNQSDAGGNKCVEVLWCNGSLWVT